MSCYATPCDEYPKPMLRYVGHSGGTVQYSVPYPISSLFVLDPRPVPEMKYFGLAVRTTTSETRYRIDGVTWTPQNSNPSMLFAGLDIEGLLIPSNYGTPWGNATITFLPQANSQHPMPQDVTIRDWTLVYQLVREGLSTNPPSNDWGCQWGINGTFNASSSFIVGSDRVTVTPSMTGQLAMFVNGTFNNEARTFDPRGPAPGPTFYFHPNMSNTAGAGLGSNQVIVFSESRAPALQSVGNWDLTSPVPMPSPVEITVSLRAAPIIGLSFVRVSRAPTVVTRMIADLKYLQVATRRERTGFSVVSQGMTNVSATSAAAPPVTLKLTSNDCVLEPDLERLHPPSSGTVTIYYVDKILDMSGRAISGYACSNHAVISLTADISTLAHELGHVLSLQDARPGGTLGPSNIMWWDTVEGTDFLTEGQIFRMHYEPRSALIGIYGNAPSPGPVNCAFDPRCPPIEAAIWEDTL